MQVVFEENMYAFLMLSLRELKTSGFARLGLENLNRIEVSHGMVLVHMPTGFMLNK